MITLIATVVGAVFGLGGGIIIKPALQAVGGGPLSAINALSGVTVLLMSAISLARYIKGGQKITGGLAWLAAGSVAGGFAGKYLFDVFISNFDERSVKTYQCALLIVIIAVILNRGRFSSNGSENAAALMCSGAVLGCVSAFLGIGGGPLNLLVIYIVMGVGAKEAAVYSIFVVLCSQAASVGSSFFSDAYAGLDLSPLFAMLPAAAVGGFAGPAIHKKMRPQMFGRYYNALLWALIALNAYNILILYI